MRNPVPLELTVNFAFQFAVETNKDTCKYLSLNAFVNTTLSFEEAKERGISNLCICETPTFFNMYMLCVCSAR